MSPPPKRDKGPKTGDVDGVQGHRTQNDEEVQAMHDSIEGLRGMGIHDGLIRDVILSSELDEARRSDTLLARLIQVCEVTLAGAQNAWSQCLDPCANGMREAHIEAKAAQMLIDWMMEIKTAGTIAAQQIEGVEDE